MAAVSVDPQIAMSQISPPRDTIIYTGTKGLLNGPGQNNCFLNSAVQVLWHLDIFRRSFRDLSGHACMAESCIFCALKELFSQLQFSNETALPPDSLRRALAESFFDQQKFQLGFMDDAAECFENMLLRIHMHIAHGEAEDMCNAKHCIPHQKFAMTLVEQSVCNSCGATSEPLPFTQMVHYVSASALTAQARQMMAGGIANVAEGFGQLLRRAGGMGDIRDCPSSCGARIQIRRSLMNHPEIVSVGLVWDSERPTLEYITDVFATVGTTLRLGEVFQSVVDKRWSETTVHNLVGVVTYYGKHYSTFFFHSKLRVWIYFDDATVREVGPRWQQVVEKCRRGRYQPLLLLYAVASGTPVDTEDAPKHVIPYRCDINPKSPSKSFLRRSVTPSPEKPNIGNTRRAITPNPDLSYSQKPIISTSYDDYQNLSVIQDSIRARENFKKDGIVDDSKNVEYVSRNCVENNFQPQKPRINVHRTLSNGSSSGTDGICLPEHLNVPRRRDSGNWSGDRNSASSSSSTTMENPYLYLVGKVPNGNNSVPGSPTRGKEALSVGGSIYDAGYDSYSLSSNDSSAVGTTGQLAKQGHLAKIPEDYMNTTAQKMSNSCDMLCFEADELLKKSRQLEEEHDLVLALALCNAAATKARAAMNAPYNNPQTLILARMKHNTCVMRARSLHRRMTQTPDNISQGRHSRQNSRDKGNHSRQNSKELFVHSAPEKVMEPPKSIEIYATLPKKKGFLKSKEKAPEIEDSEYIICEKKSSRESRNTSKSKGKDELKVRDKRSRSEDRGKILKDFSVAPNPTVKESSKKEKAKEEKEDKKSKDEKGKKQHKIRRKLLMGGLIKRKNRSMPDLTDGNIDIPVEDKKLMVTVDDSKIGIADTDKKSNMCGYLSEGHLEFTGNINANPNLERSKLMRKSFHGSAGKVLTAAKVPPPPPLRTTSQLTANKLEGSNNCYDDVGKQEFQKQYERSHYQNTSNVHGYDVPDSGINRNSPVQTSLPYLPMNSICRSLINSQYGHQEQREFNISSDNSFEQNPVDNRIITTAVVHQEQSPMRREMQFAQPVDEVDTFTHDSLQNLDLPPYPSPIGSVVHSRQASEEFPPPPPGLDLSPLEEHLGQSINQKLTNGFHDYGEMKPKTGQEISTKEMKYSHGERIGDSRDGWLKELQAKQEAFKVKKSEKDGAHRKLSTDSNQSENSKMVASVKDLASKFENINVYPSGNNVSKPNQDTNENSTNIKNALFYAQSLRELSNSPINMGVLSLKKREENDVINGNKGEEYMQTKEGQNQNVPNTRPVRTKKKSVSFCDQVILVATAEEQEDDSFIPNPILERVLRTALTKTEDNSSEVSPTKTESPTRTAFIEKTITIKDRVGSVDNLYVSRSTDNAQKDVDVVDAPNVQNNHSDSNPKHINYYQENQNSYPVNYNTQPQNMNYDLQNPNNINRRHSDSLIRQAMNESQNQNHINRQTSHSEFNQNLVRHSPSVYQMQNGYQGTTTSNNMSHYSPSPTPSVNQQYGTYYGPQQQVNNQPSAAQHYQQNYGPQISDYSKQSHMNNYSRQVATTNEQTHAEYLQHNGVTHQNNQFRQNRHSQSTGNMHPRSQPTSDSQYYSNSLQNGNAYNRQVQQNPLQHPNSLLRSQYGPEQPQFIQNGQNTYQRHSLPKDNSQNSNFNSQQQSNTYQRVPQPLSDYPGYNYNPQYDAGQQKNQNPTYYRKTNVEQQRMVPGDHQNSVYHSVPRPEYNNGNYNHQPNNSNYHGDDQMYPNGYQPQNSVYQMPPKYMPYQPGLQNRPGAKKTVSFGESPNCGNETPTPKAVVTPIIVNQMNNKTVNINKTKCNLCRKKVVSHPSMYCTDCEFYMSRFKPKT